MINGSFLLPIINEKYLFLKRDDNGLWEIPGGGYEIAEHDYTKVALRELKEETGIILTKKKVQLCAILGQRLKKTISEQYGGIEMGLAFVHCSILYETVTVTLSDEHTDYRLFTYEEINNEWQTFSSGPLWMFFTYLTFKQKGKVQEGLLKDRKIWQGKEY